MQFFSLSLSQMVTSVPFNHILSSVNEGSAVMVVFAQSSSLDNVPLTESLTGKLSFSSRFPPRIESIPTDHLHSFGHCVFSVKVYSTKKSIVHRLRSIYFWECLDGELSDNELVNLTADVIDSEMRKINYPQTNQSS